MSPSSICGLSMLFCYSATQRSLHIPEGKVKINFYLLSSNRLHPQRYFGVSQMSPTCPKWDACLRQNQCSTFLLRSALLFFFFFAETYVKSATRVLADAVTVYGNVELKCCFRPRRTFYLSRQKVNSCEITTKLKVVILWCDRTLSLTLKTGNSSRSYRLENHHISQDWMWAVIRHIIEMWLALGPFS